MANNMNLPRNADTAAGGKWINELIPKINGEYYADRICGDYSRTPPPSAASGVVQAAECDWNHQKVH